MSSTLPIAVGPGEDFLMDGASPTAVIRWKATDHQHVLLPHVDMGSVTIQTQLSLY